MIIADGLVIRGCTRTGGSSPGSTFTFPVYDDEVFDISPGSGLFQKGDISFLSDCVQGLSATIPTFVTPSGFTNIGGGTNLSGTSLDGFGMRAYCYYKIWLGTEAGDIVTGMNGTGKNRKNLMTFRMSRPVQSITVLATDGTFQQGNPAAISAAGAGQVGNILVLGWAHGESAVSSWTFTNGTGTDYFQGSNAQATDATGEGGGNFIRSGYSYYPYGDTPLTSSIDIADFGDFNLLQSVVVSLT